MVRGRGGGAMACDKPLHAIESLGNAHIRLSSMALMRATPGTIQIQVKDNLQFGSHVLKSPPQRWCISFHSCEGCLRSGPWRKK